MGRSVEDFLKTANDEEMVNRKNDFEKATRGVALEILEVPKWAKIIFDKYLNLEFSFNKMFIEITKTATKEENLQKLFYIGVICGRLEELTIRHAPGETNLWKIKDVVLKAKEYDFKHAFCTFLDDFKYAYDKYSLIKDEPPEMDGITKKEYSVLAATAHKLANDNKLPIPGWVHNPKYVLDTPYYSFDSKEGQQYLKKISPVEFKERNLFVTDTAIERI